MRESGTLVTDIGTAAVANNLLRRKEQDEARRERLTQTLTLSPLRLFHTYVQLLLFFFLFSFTVQSARFRLETLEGENKITLEKFEEVAQGWSEALEIVIPQDLEEAINWQKGLCRVIIEDKERLVAELQNVNLPSYH